MYQSTDHEFAICSVLKAGNFRNKTLKITSLYSVLKYFSSVHSIVPYTVVWYFST